MDRVGSIGLQMGDEDSKGCDLPVLQSGWEGAEPELEISRSTSILDCFPVGSDTGSPLTHFMWA